MTVRTAAAVFASGLLALGAAFAADPSDAPAGYVRTGESKHCLPIRQIDQMKILNESQILVEMSGGKTYLQQPKSCNKLRSYYAFTYDTVGGELCDTTAVSLINPGSGAQFVGVCLFDEFHQIEKQSAAK